MADTVTEEKVKQEEQKVEQKVDEAGDKAKIEAENQGLSPEDVQKQVERARKEEKDKLYPQIEGLKSDLKEIQNILKAEREEKNKIQKEAERRAEQERQSKLSDVERTQEILSRLEEQLKDEREERKRFESRLAERDRKDELDRYRNRLIEANKDEIIPELVHGNSVEELDESLEIAKARYKEFEEKFNQRRSDTTRRGMPGPTNPDIEALEEQELSRDLTQFDGDKYLEDANYRRQIQAGLANEYARLAGRR